MSIDRLRWRSVNPWHPGSFGGDFDALPLRSSILFAAVPTHPISEDFQNAASGYIHEEAAARWRLEAIRWRLSNKWPLPLDLRAIAVKCAAAFHNASTEEQSGLFDQHQPSGDTT